ncbi:hypothetical protein [Mycetocola zhujimingii]|uniref:Uncharacterized protein n=1 Tax=Mycetocola zhujimingii TaxID=2079792 RepID=A0A2U1TG41_9MICO|nr:hypothetical protein [Mycetocola zhujimingii]PWC07851.1 hypothetical protein DF223_00345 [Mycetocola zhujimingii]
MNNPDNRPVDPARDEPVLPAQPTDAWPADPERDPLGGPVPEPHPAADAAEHNPQHQAEPYQEYQQPRHDGGEYQEQPYPTGGYQPEQYPAGQYGQYQQEQYQQEQYQQEQFQQDQYAADQYPAGQDQTGQYPAAPHTAQQYAGYPEQQYPGQQYPEQQFQSQSFEGQPASGQTPAGQTGGPGPRPEALTGPGAEPRQRKPRRPRTDENGVAYGVGPFSLREAVFVILSALVVVASFFPLIGGLYAEFFGYSSVWAPAPWLAIPGALLLAAAAALIVIRRVQPQRRLRVGSLSVDQFASAAAVTTAGFYLGALLTMLGFTAWFRPGAFGGNPGGDNFDGLTPGAGLILGLIFSLASIVPTACARFVPVFAEDFSRRAESPAHPAAREAAVVPVRPRPVRHTAEPQPEVHHYGLEHSGSVQLTPADTRPEDFAAYRRSGWSPDSASDSDPSYAEFQEARESNAGLGDDAPDSNIPPATQATTGMTGATMDDSLLGDEVDEFHTGEEPAPVSAIRHVAEQESLADASGRENPEPEPLHPSAQEHGSRAEVLPEVLPDAPRQTEAERTSQDADELAPELTSEAAAELAPELAPEKDDELAPETLPETGEEPETSSETVSGSHGTRAPDAGHTASASQAAAKQGPGQTPPAVISTQPFWVYSPVLIAVVDEETGAPVFEIGPDAWALAIVDRGTELVIRHDDGRVGVLREITGIMRG